MRTPGRHRTLIGMAVAAAAAWTQSSRAQILTASQNHVTIPFLASATKPADLQFEGAECDVDGGGRQMTCAFQQLFLTTSSVAPDTCLATTNRYERVFRRDASERWTSREGPTGVCGLVDVVTLTNEGGIRWMMEVKKEVTRRGGSVACGTMQPETEVFTWQNIRRPLPCTNVQPGALTP